VKDMSIDLQSRWDILESDMDAVALHFLSPEKRHKLIQVESMLYKFPDIIKEKALKMRHVFSRRHKSFILNATKSCTSDELSSAVLTLKSLNPLFESLKVSTIEGW